MSATLAGGATVATGPTRAGSVAAGGVGGAVDGGVVDVADVAGRGGDDASRRAGRVPAVASGGGEDGRDHNRRGGHDSDTQRDREPPAAIPPELSEEGLARCRRHDVGRNRFRHRGQPGRRRGHPIVQPIGGRGELLAKLDQRRPAGGFWIQGAPNRPTQRRRNRDGQRRSRAHHLSGDECLDSLVGPPGERRRTDQRRRQGRGQAVDVAPRAVGFAAQGLWRHVFGRERDDVGRRRRLPAQQPSDPEVAELDPAVSIQQHVSRLDVAVEDAELVCRDECVGDRHADLRHGRRWQWPFGRDDVTERPAVEVLGDEVRVTGLGPPGRVHGDNVGVGGQAGDRCRLPAKLTPRPLVLDAATQHLDRDQSVEGLLTGEVHDRRTTVAERAQDRVTGQYRTRCVPRLRAGPAVGAEKCAGRQIGVALPAHGRRCGICTCSHAS